MGKVIIPKTYVREIEDPLVFLAGPIIGAPNWQDEAIEILFSMEPDLVIATPRRGIRDRIAPYVVNGDENYFPRQRAWERHYLDIASKTGAILFWLPGQAEYNPNKVYGATTRLELGQWMTNYRYDNSVRFCIGTDGNFPEVDIILYDLKLDAPDKKVFPSLKETCAEAIRLAYKND